MLDTKAAPITFYLYQCKSGEHRIFRRDEVNNAPCSRCGSYFTKIAAIPREEGESEVHHSIRTLNYKPEKTQ